MRKLALSVACLSLPFAIASCGDDLPASLDAQIIYVPTDAIVIINPDAGMGMGGAEAGTTPDTAPMCPSASFITPMPGAMLTAVDDKDGGGCANNGFQIDVTMAVGAPNGTAVTLLANNAPVGSSTVTGGIVTFTTVTLGTSGASNLVAQVGSAAGCTVEATVTVNCSAVDCNITKPVISEAHPKLNDVPAEQGGDRVSSPGSDYQAAFEVTTNAPDNSVVQLQVRRSGQESTTLINATVLGGKANFPGVTLRPDGGFQIQAVCKSGVVEGRSQLGTYTVDTVAPELTIVSPVAGQFFGPGDLTGGKFKVCAATTAQDAVGLGMALPRTGANLGAGIGMSLEFVPMVAAGGGGGAACVDLICGGGAPFDLTVRLYDEAGNATVKTVSGVTCASALPSVQIMQPLGDVEPFTDVSRRLLSATSNQVLRDLNANQAGAQTNVRACTDKGNGATARLLAGPKGSSLIEVGQPVAVRAATALDECPAGLGFVAEWLAATLPESPLQVDGTLQAPTQLRVTVTEISTAVGTSPAVELWVDPSAPSVNPFDPVPLCGTIIPSDTARTINITFTSNTKLAELTVNGPGGEVSYSPAMTAQGSLRFDNVLLGLGESQIFLVARDPAGNVTRLPDGCSVKVGQVPIVTWISPPLGKNLCAVDSGSSNCVDDSGVESGWQGSLGVSVVVAGVPATSGTVTFSVGGTVVDTVSIDGSGVATLPGVSIADAPSVTLFAETSDITGTGKGQATRNVVVDTVKPGPVTELAAAIPDALRRQVTYRLSWKAPDDGGQRAASYDVRVALSEISENDFAAAESVSFTGQAAEAGQSDSVDVPNRRLRKTYHFAVAARDSAGNRGPISSTTGLQADFFGTLIEPPDGGPTNERFGNSIDGFADLNGDGLSDILVGSFNGTRAYVYFGRATPTANVSPDLIFTGPADAAFGRSFVAIGDIDKDGLEDIAISSPQDPDCTLYVFKGRANWKPSAATVTYAHTQADYEIKIPGAAGTFLGGNLARLGDFNGDGVDDFGVSATLDTGAQGRVVVVLGSAAFSSADFKTISITGDGANGFFGTSIVGLGRFFASPGTTMVVSATGVNASAGKVYAIRGIEAESGVYSISDAAFAASHVIAVDGPAAGAQYGRTLGLLGPLPGGLPGVLSTSWTSSVASSGFVDALYGSESLGPFSGPTKRFINTAATVGGASGDNFARIMFGSAFSGSSVITSLVGNSVPDFVAVAAREGGSPQSASVYVVDGATFTSLPAGNIDIRTVADVVLPLPADWGAVAAQQRGMLRDLTGDGFGDMAISSSSGKGKILVYW